MVTSSLFALLALGTRFRMERIVAAMRRALSPRLAPALGAVIVVLYWARNATLFPLMQRPAHPANVTLPLEYLDGRAQAAMMNADLLFAISEVACLAALAAVVGRLSVREYVVVAFGAGGSLLFLALLCPWLASEDVYLYIGQALLGRDAYAPPAIAFTGDLASINRLWGTPLLPSAYGPLYLALARAAIALGPSLAAKLSLLRMVGAGSFVACALLVRALNAPRAVVIALAVNPALVDLYVTNAHNDLLAIDFVLAALVLARRDRLALALGVATCAVLVKVTMLVPGLFVCAAAPTRSRRLIAAAAYVALACASYYVLAGPAVVHAMSSASRAYTYVYAPLEFALRLCLVGAALTVAFVALWSSRVYARGAWSIAGIGQFILAWYVPWGLPCALADPGVALVFALSLPLAIVACDGRLIPTPLYEVWAGATILILLVGVARAYIALRRGETIGSSRPLADSA